MAGPCESGEGSVGWDFVSWDEGNIWKKMGHCDVEVVREKRARRFDMV
jgi:hypothetical protein